MVCQLYMQTIYPLQATKQVIHKNTLKFFLKIGIKKWTKTKLIVLVHKCYKLLLFNLLCNSFTIFDGLLIIPS